MKKPGVFQGAGAGLGVRWKLQMEKLCPPAPDPRIILCRSPCSNPTHVGRKTQGLHKPAILKGVLGHPSASEEVSGVEVCSLPPSPLR